MGSEDDVTFNDNRDIGDVGKGYNAGTAYSNSGASNEQLLQTERYMPSGQTELTYNVQVPNGTYTIRTHLNELYFGEKLTAPMALAAAPVQRVFDILVEGVFKVDDFDLAAANNANSDTIGDIRCSRKTEIRFGIIVI